MARGTARAPGGGLRRGSAALLTDCPVEGRWTDPAGLPPGTGSIHAHLGANCQVRQDAGAPAAMPYGRRKGVGHTARPSRSRSAVADGRCADSRRCRAGFVIPAVSVTTTSLEFR
jgi:hypothetical protein